MNTKLMLGLAAFALMASPVAFADHADDSDLTVGDVYVVAGDDGVTLYEETNGHEGLQTEDEFDEDGELILKADEELLA